MRIRSFTKLFVIASLAMSAAVAACGDDDNYVVRTRDGGSDATTDAGEGGPPNTLACGVPIPATYESPSFAANAKEELDLKERLLAIGDKMAESGVENMFVSRPKQWNQAARGFVRYLGYRALSEAAQP